MLRKLFGSKPKWQHKDPEIRRRAIQALGPGDGETLRQILREEQQPGLRRLAVQALCDLPQLDALLQQEGDAVVREVALARLRKLLAGDVTEQERRWLPSAEQRLAWLTANPDQELLGQLALQIADPGFRQGIVALLTADDALAAVAIGDKVAAIRQMAVERLQEAEALERVYRDTRKRDKQVSRTAKEKLDALAAQRERPLRIRADAERLCDRVERLGRGKQWEQDDATLAYLGGQWESLATDAGALLEPEMQARYAAACDAYRAAAAVYHQEQQRQRDAAEAQQAARAEQAQLLQRLEALGEALSAAGTEPDEALTAGFKQSLGELRRAWEELEPAGSAGSLETRFDRLIDELSGRLKMQAERRSALAVATELCETLERTLGQRAPLAEADLQAQLQRLRKRLDALPHDDEYRRLHERFTALRERAEQRTEQQRGQRRQKLHELPTWIDQFATAIDDGQAKAAAGLLDRIQTALSFCEAGGAASETAPLQQRLRQHLPRFREMQGWQKWAVEQERDRLCAEMEGLVGSDTPPAELRERIRTMQQAWKNLESGRLAAPQELWHRFQEAANRAYEPVKVWEAEQAAERERHRQAREALLAGIATELEGIDWSAPDWKAVANRERELRREWREQGQVERKVWQRLEREFQTLMERFDKPLNAERDRNLRLRRGLIERIEALATLDDLTKAIDETKALQQQWVVTVPGRRGEENQLWRRFRAACDAVFERRREARESRDRDEQENLQRKQALCAEIEGLQATNPDETRRHLHELEAAWQALGHVPKRDIGAIEGRYRKALQRCEAQIDELLRQEERAGMELLKAKAALCLQLEQAAANGSPPDTVEALQTQWQAFGPLAEKEAERALQQRFAAALTAASGDADAKQRLLEGMAEADAARRELCLHMEVLAGIDSPPDATEARMAFQVARLSEAMQAGRNDPAAEAWEVEQAWHLAGFAGSASQSALEERFQRALDHLLRRAA